MSIAGLIVNFLYPYLAYRLWRRMMQGHEIRLDFYAMGSFWVTTFIVTFPGMLLLAACGMLFFARHFESKFIRYFGNSIFWAMLAGPVLLLLLFKPAVRNGYLSGREWQRGPGVA